jgi:hypothetical protein
VIPAKGDKILEFGQRYHVKQIAAHFDRLSRREHLQELGRKGGVRSAESRRCEAEKLIRRSYWLDMDDRTLVMVMVNGIGANLTNEEKRAHLIDLRREHLIDKVCIQEILPPER